MSEHKINPTELVNEHSDYLLNFAMSKLSDLDLAKDLVQDTFISALTKLDSFEKRAAVRTWLTSILNNKIIDYWRKAETRYTDPASHFFDFNDPHKHWIIENNINQSMESIENHIIQEDNISELHDCIKTLPSKWSGILSSKYLQDKKSEEICKEFDVTTSNLWVIIHRAKLLMRECLQSK
jgi:RNA polymerase sigma-70 factor (ECF subfamily)